MTTREQLFEDMIGRLTPDQLEAMLTEAVTRNPSARQAIEDASRGIDWAADRTPMRSPGQPPPPDVPTAQSAFNPLAERLSAWGVGQGGIVGDLARRIAPGVSGVEGAARTIGNMGIEMTGVPAADRAARAFAEGETGRGVVNAITALPGRGAAILGGLLSSAEAQAPDPRREAIRTLEAEIARREREISNLGRRTRDPDRLEVLVQPHQDAITAARDRIKGLQGSIDAEANQRRLQVEADTRAATWRNTPTARAYPWSQPLTAGIGAAAGFLVPFTGARRAVTAHNARINDIATRWEDAVGRANNTRLAPGRRTQAANEARELQAEFDRVIAAAPGHGGRFGAALTGAGLTDLGVATPTIIDYLSSRGDPTGPLANYTMQSINPTNPDLWGRLGLGFLGGGVIGELGHELGNRGVDRPTGYAAETATLRRRYRKGQ